MIAPTLDSRFSPPILRWQHYCRRMGSHARPFHVALERENGHVYHKTLLVDEHDAETRPILERTLKFLLWSQGGWRISVSGAPALTSHLQATFMSERMFDRGIMETTYGRSFRFDVVDVPMAPSTEVSHSVGGHTDGCRIGFDLGASDYKIAAVIDGAPVFTDEIPWNPSQASHSSYHFHHIRDGIERARAHLPRLDAIGGSSAGIIVDNCVRIASLFRGLSPDDFNNNIVPFFRQLSSDYKVPVSVMNDGDVTALAGAMSLKVKGILGLAMGSSEAAGFVDRQGRISGALNELAFAPVDWSSEAAVDEWSHDRGCGALYFSQQAVDKLSKLAGTVFSDSISLPERLRIMQERANQGDPMALQVFESMGTYLAYTLPYYMEFYDMEHVLVLGRVTSGEGGERLLATARAVLKSEFPDIHERLAIHVPDERMRRVGQAVAAASLPMIQRGHA